MSDSQPPVGYIEELNAGPRPIEGVSTTTAAFIGEAETGPLTPQLITSYSQYTQTFGGVFGPQKFLPHAISGFFENGGARAVVSRIAAPATSGYAAALSTLEKEAWRDVSLVYAPCAPADVAKAVIAHCEKMRYRFAVIDCAAGQHDASLLAPRVSIADSSYAAFYHPWIFAAEPGSGARTLMPPGGHVLGIYARTDAERGVFKAPANEVVRGAIGVEFTIPQVVRDTLPLKGVNVIRAFQGRGIRVWGARTMSSDTQWKFVSVRRLFMFLERSIDEGLRWAVFEPNDARLWVKAAGLIENFLRVQWRAGALLGRTEREAFFVRFDQSTMTQDDIANGRLVGVVGVAPLRPAEFVNFRIFQKTAS